MQTLLLTALMLGAAPWELVSPPRGQFALDETKTLRADTLEDTARRRRQVETGLVRRAPMVK